MAKLNLSTITSGYATVDALNANFDAIETAFENTLSRDGTAPNPMEANIDMDSNRIINAADGVNSTDVPTLRQLTALIAAAEIENAVVLTETQTATAGQTVFNLAGIVYSPGANNLSIFVNGLRLHPGDYTETDENTVTMASGLADGDDVFFLTNEELLITDTVNITGGHINAAVIGNTTPAAGTFTDLTATGNTVLGDAAADTITVNTNNLTLATPLTVTGTWANLGTVTTVDINGGTIDGAVIGGSSAAAGSFTTLSSTGNATLGDAAGDSHVVNGLLNVQTGSAASVTAKGLQIRFDNTNNTGHISASQSGTANYPLMLGADGFATVGIYIDALGRVGIGTSTPATYAGFAVRRAVTAATGRLTSASFSDASTGTVDIVHGSGYIGLDTQTSANALRISQGGTNVGVFSSTGLAVTGAISSTTGATFATSSGNVGIGTSSPSSKLDVRSGIITAGDVSSVFGQVIAQGYYLNDTDRIVNLGSMYSTASCLIGYAVKSSQVAADSFVSTAGNANFVRGALVVDDSLRFLNASGSTTAVGSAVTMTERMRIDSSGNVGIGTSSPSYLLDIGSATGTVDLATAGVRIRRSGVATNWSFINNISGALNLDTYDSAGGIARFRTSTNGSTFSEQVRINHTASAVNYLTLTGSSTGNPLVISAEGSDTDIAATLVSKGAGNVRLSTGSASNIQVLVSATASANRYITLTGSNGGNPRIDTNAGSLVLGSGGLTNAFAITGSGSGAPILSPVGAANLGIAFYSAGTGAIDFGTAGGTLQVKVAHTASAVNYVQMTGSVTGNSPLIQVAGSDSNISLNIASKGTGGVNIYTNGTNNVAGRFLYIASSVNFLDFVQNTTGNAPYIQAQGSDTNIALALSSKGTSAIDFYTNSTTTRQLSIINTASAVNYLEMRGAATTGAPGIAARGSDTNINLSFDTKGTGSHVFTTGTLAATQAVIQHRASADLYLTLTGGQTGVVNPTIGVSGGALAISCALVLSQTTLLQTSVALTNGAGAATGTLTNAPTAGNPTKWIPINDNGTTRYIPAW